MSRVVRTLARPVAVVAVLTCCAAVGAGASFGAGGTTAGIAFVKSVKSTSVWVSAPDGTGARKLGSASDPVLSPNGEMVAADAFGPKGSPLVVFTVAGGKLTVPAALDAKVSVTPLVWSPDSRYLAVAVIDSSTGPGPGDAALDVIDTTNGSISAHDGGVVMGASFEPGTSDTVVFGLSQSQLTSAPRNLYSMPADGSSGATQLTSDGHSINPVWGKRGIVYDKVTPRKNGPEYQLVLMNGSKRTQITHMKIPELLQGLVPLAVSADGTKLVAQYEGEDTSEGYTVNLITHTVTDLKVPKQENSASGISTGRHACARLLRRLRGPLDPRCDRDDAVRRRHADAADSRRRPAVVESVGPSFRDLVTASFRGKCVTTAFAR